MLKNYFLSAAFYKYAQSGFYFDFLMKKLSEIFIRNLLICSALFFGEKYLIEFLTKGIFINFFKQLEIFFDYSAQTYEIFFYNVFTLILIFIMLFQMFYLII